MNQTTSEAAKLLGGSGSGGGGGQLDLKNAAAETPLNALAEAPFRFPPWLAPVKASSPIQLLRFHCFSPEEAQRRDPETFPCRLLSEAECKKKTSAVEAHLTLCAAAETSLSLGKEPTLLLPSLRFRSKAPPAM